MDTYSEEYRHECEARTALRMTLNERKAHLQRVEVKRGAGERRRLENTMHGIWVEHHVVKLLAMDMDRERIVHLTRLERATNLRTREKIERVLMGRLAAMNDN